MNRDLCDQLPYEVRADYRVLLLSRLLWGDPTEWRLRRTDTFSDRDSASFELNVAIDVRVRRSEFEYWLAQLGELYQDSPALLEKSEPVHTCELLDGLIKNAEDPLVSDASWVGGDVILPVGWAYGPPVQMEIEVDGRPTAHLGRFDTAELVTKTINYLVVRFGKHLGSPPVDAKTMPSLRRFFWLMTATDMFALLHEPALKGVKWRGDVDKIVNQLLLWMNAALFRQALGPLPEGRVQHPLRQAVRAVIEFQERHLEGDRSDAFCTPFWNPLLLFPAYLHYASRTLGDEAMPAPYVLATQFIAQCSDYMQICDLLLKQRDLPGDSAIPAHALIDAAQRLSWSWPLLIRAEIEADKTYRLSYSMISSPREQSRGLWRCYDLAPGDAAGYHVEVEAPHQELELRKGRAKVVLRGLRQTSSIPADIYFHRVTETSGGLHTFYQACLDPPGLVNEDDGSSQVLLRVRQTIQRSVSWTNWILAIALMLGTSYLAYLAWVDVADYPVISESFGEAGRVMISAFLAYLVLFTLERHGNPVVARRLEVPWRLAVLTLALAFTLTLVRAVGVSADSETGESVRTVVRGIVEGGGK